MLTGNAVMTNGDAATVRIIQYDWNISANWYKNNTSHQIFTKYLK